MLGDNLPSDLVRKQGCTIYENALYFQRISLRRASRIANTSSTPISCSKPCELVRKRGGKLLIDSGLSQTCNTGAVNRPPCNLILRVTGIGVEESRLRTGTGLW